MILSQYCIIYNKFFTEHECDLIHAVAETRELQEGLIGNSQTDPDAPDESEGVNDNFIRQSDVRWIEHDIMPQEIQQKITDGINQACVDGRWLHQWDFIENHQYTVYNHRPDAQVTGDFYTWHVDASDQPQPNGKIRKLSSTIQLSEPDEYEGGHFQWIETTKVFDKLKFRNDVIRQDELVHTAPMSGRELGSLIVFPSWLPHQVTPVTHGVRKSLVVWHKGWPLK